MVRCKLLFPSQWTRKESEPASANSSRKRSGSEIIRCVSRGRRVTRRSAWTIGVPMERLGTKCPSMTSTWIRSAPALSASATCSPKREKSAARIEGASVTGPLSISEVSRGHNPWTGRVIRNAVIRFLTDPPVIASSGVGRFKDALDGPIQYGVVLGIRLLDRQPLHQRSRETRHDAVIPAQALVRFLSRITAR